MRNDWRRFCGLIWTKWESRMTGSLFVALILTVGGLFLVGIGSLLLFLFVLAGCLLVAAYQVWRDECRNTDKVAVERDTAIDKLKPKLEFSGVGPHGQDHYRVTVRNLTQRSIQFKVRLAEARPPLQDYPLPVELQPTHCQMHETLGEVGPNDEQPVDVFIFGPLREVYVNRQTGEERIMTVDSHNRVQLKVIGNPPLPHPLPVGTKQEIRLFVYPVSEPGEGEKRWFSIAHADSNSVTLSPDGGTKEATPTNV
jgi:hypothetical protein